MEKNQEKTGTVIAVGSNGEGILYEDTYVVFLPFSYIGEKVRYKVLKVAKNLVYGKVIEVISPSKERVKPVCPVYQKCGGCHISHLTYAAQLKVKENNVKTCFSKIAYMSVDVMPCVKSDLQFNYRNKLQLPVANSEKGAILGFYAPNSHRVIEINDCPINPSWTKDLIKAFKIYFKEFDIKGYNEQTSKGEIREITAKEIDNNLIITVVCLTNSIKGKDRLIEILKENLKLNFSLYYNKNNKATNVIYGEEFRLLYGDGAYSSEMLGIKYKIGVQSFMQVNTLVCKKLYSEVKKAVNCNGENLVIDAYSGAGLMTAILAKDSKKAIGVEIVKEATVLADELAKDNELTDKIKNYNARCEDVIPKIVKEESNKTDNLSIVLDPPRKGCDVKVISAIKESNVNKIVYVSCMPSTLARDVGLLVGTLELKDGQIVKAENPKIQYKIDFIKPFDMFPETKHVETLVCLSKKTEKHINIDVEFGEGEGQVSLKKLQEELNGQKPKKKTTYKDIQAYVEEKYGVKVHTAYIAEVKRDLGLPMYDAPNAVEELKRPRSHPTTEMIEAIKDALKHFEVI
jgi:23S rRNA (uracil1939-C5)-methyltransferase